VPHAEEHAADTQNRIADAITRFSGSMAFVYLQIVWFASWIGFGVEKYPFGLRTEPRAARPLKPDPRAGEGRARIHERDSRA